MMVHVQKYIRWCLKYCLLIWDIILSSKFYMSAKEVRPKPRSNNCALFILKTTLCSIISFLQDFLHALNSYTTGPFTVLELQHPSIDDSELNKIRRSTDFEALKLWNRSSGSCFSAQSPTCLAISQLQSHTIIDQRILCCSELPIDGFWGSETVKCPVRLYVGSCSQLS